MTIQNDTAGGCCAPAPEAKVESGCCGGAVAVKPGPFVAVRAWVAANTAVTAIGVALAVVAVADPAQVPQSIAFVGRNLWNIFPFLAAAIGLAAYARATGADGLIAHVFSGRLGIMILAASLFGALSPFCSCGVIPLIAALLSMGVPLPAVMAFWLASPIMDPSMFALTAGTLGVDFAVAKTLAAVGIGLMGGAVTWFMQSAGMFADPLRSGVGNGGCGGAKVRSVKAVAWRFWEEDKRRETFGKEARASFLFLGKWLAIAFFLESLMLAYVPADAIAKVLGSGSGFAIPLAVLAGVPAYLNGYAALPLVAGLLDMGVSPGAGMAFLVAGGVTSIPAAIAVFALVKKPVFALYIALSMAGGLLAGLGWQVYIA